VWERKAFPVPSLAETRSSTHLELELDIQAQSFFYSGSKEFQNPALAADGGLFHCIGSVLLMQMELAASGTPEREVPESMYKVKVHNLWIHSFWTSLQLLLLRFQSLNDKRHCGKNYTAYVTGKPEKVQSEDKAFDSLFGLASLELQMLLYVIRRNDDASTR
jgi:hypothetical protein